MGRALQRTLAPVAPLVMPARADADLANLSSLCRLIRSTKPGLIVNAAAYTAVDRAEAEPDLAWRVNADAPGAMGEEARRLGIPLLHYSTDYVFDGSKATPYVETDEPNPLSSYGRSKLGGERAIRDSAAYGAILRTSWVFGETGANFVQTILRLAAERETLRVVSDQIGAPTPAALIAEVSARVIVMLESEGWPAGELYHLASCRSISWHGFARTIVEKAWQHGMASRLRPEAIEPIDSKDYPTAARRPLNSRLDCGKLETRFTLELPDWEPYLERVVSGCASTL